MRVSELMTRSVRTARADDNLASIANMMWESDCGCVPIVDDEGRPIAMITDRDICMAALTTGLPIEQIHASTAMSRAIFSVHEPDSLEKAEETMRGKQVRRLPVVDPEGRLIGLLSLGDLIRHAAVRARKPSEQDGLSTNTIAWTLVGVTEPHAAMKMASVVQPAKA